ncbi:MAG: hypothetical protein K2Q01_07085, partial [Rickettsiales bacterium]|nr:hypothetical protein [Rickettsiales bacterium]
MRTLRSLCLLSVSLHCFPAFAQATMPEAAPIKDRGDGQFIWGPSGAPIWNSASLDVKRNRLYVGTGEANSGPAHPNTDALMSFDL